MKAVVALEAGVVELNYLWLPTFIGMNSVLKAEMEKELASQLTGVVLDEQGLSKAHNLVVSFLTKKYPDIKGLDRYLDALKFIELQR